MAVLAAYAASGSGVGLDQYLRDQVFRNAAFDTVDPDPADVAGFTAFLDRYRAGLAAERAAVTSL
jgi:hypothetical protein